MKLKNLKENQGANKMDKKLEKALASYLNKVMDYAEYSKITTYLDTIDKELRNKFNNWCTDKGSLNTK